MNNNSIHLAYTSPNGTEIPNPILLTQQIEGLREVIERLQTTSKVWQVSSQVKQTK